MSLEKIKVWIDKSNNYSHFLVTKSLYKKCVLNMPQNKTSTVSVRMPIKQKQRLFELAQLENAKLTELLSEAVELYLIEKQKQAKLKQLLVLQKDLSKIETWDSQTEIELVENSRNSKKFI